VQGGDGLGERVDAHESFLTKIEESRSEESNAHAERQKDAAITDGQKTVAPEQGSERNCSHFGFTRPLV